jgi:DNA-binding NarL/FixJ family response regulator
MRVLIADRNARLLESISRTFAQQFTIEVAASCEKCNELLARGEFDLVLISEKLADGPGLHLLGQIVRSSPDTLRVFAARRSRLQLLKGKLGPFGLFRTLSYPINPQEILSTLTLAQTGLAIGTPVPEVALEAQPHRAPPAPAEVHPVVERISLTSADATFTIDVPKTILSQRKARRSNSAAAHRPASAARRAPAPAAPVRNAAAKVPGNARQAQKVPPELPGNARQARKAPPALPSTVRQSQRATSQPAATAPQSQRVASQQPPAVAQQASTAPQSARAQQHPAPRPVRSQAAVARSAPAARSPSQSGASQHASRSHRAANRPVKGTQYPMRSKIMLAAASVVVFVVTTLTLNLNDASVHVTQASTPRPRIDLPPPPEPRAALAPAFNPQPSVARHLEPKPDVDAVGGQVTASNAPVADPSTFGHEAYEVIYAN